MSPQAEYERCLLGCALLEPALADGEQVPESYFTDPRNRAVWQAMLSLRATGAPLTLITLYDSLPSEKVPAAYIAKLSDTVPSAAPAPFYINMLREAARVRAIRQLLAEVEHKASQGQESDSLVAALEAALFDLRRSGNVTATTWPEEQRRAGRVTEVPNGFVLGSKLA